MEQNNLKNSNEKTYKLKKISKSRFNYFQN